MIPRKDVENIVDERKKDDHPAFLLFLAGYLILICNGRNQRATKVANDFHCKLHFRISVSQLIHLTNVDH